MIKKKGKEIMSVDENDVGKVQSTLSNWVSQFLQSDADKLCHVASEMTALRKIQEDLSQYGPR